MPTSLPHVPISTIATPTKTLATDPSAEYPLLAAILSTDSVGPQAANQQPAALDRRTETVRGRTNLLIDVVNAVDANFLHRDGTLKLKLGVADPHFMRGDLDMTDPTPTTGAAYKVINMAAGTVSTDGVNKAQLDALQAQVTATIAQLGTDFVKRDGTLAMTGNLDMGSFQVQNLGAAVNPNDAVRKTEFDTTVTALQNEHVRRDGTKTMQGSLDMGGNRIINVQTVGFPNVAADVATKAYVDGIFGSIASIAGGTIVAFGGATIPTGWVLCDGRSLDTTAFVNLFNAIQYKYGGSGSNFNVPDLRGRVLAGFDNYDGQVTSSPPPAAGAAGRLNSFGNSSVFNGAFGAQTHTLTVSELASHTHTYDDAYMATGAGAGLQGVSAPDAVSTLQSVSPQPSTGPTGSGGAHNNVQPSMAIVFMIKAL